MIQQFLQECSERKHISLMLPEKGLQVEIQANHSYIQFFLSKENISFKPSQEHYTTIHIECEPDIIEDWLLGKKKFQDFIHMKSMKVRGNFRDILRLESIVLLAKPYIC
ncbi:hypothetical protein [Peribacillus acanthi]|uniref:hypothetical protein n=1 Tax=Peribacillus acanthi TaxID=2171554 RepID=UPI00130045CE|nr:hypothetical protein [Peribacillus acanthi]